MKGKLSDGESISEGDCKFIASFRRENVHFCTASLLSNKHAVTSAFCLKDFLTEIDIPDFDLYSLVAGRLDMPKGSAVFKIEQVEVHRKFTFISPSPLHSVGLITVNHLLKLF